MTNKLENMAHWGPSKPQVNDLGETMAMRFDHKLDYYVCSITDDGDEIGHDEAVDILNNQAKQIEQLTKELNQSQKHIEKLEILVGISFVEGCHNGVPSNWNHSESRKVRNDPIRAR